jgi:hypothetical protein
MHGLGHGGGAYLEEQIGFGKDLGASGAQRRAGLDVGGVCKPRGGARARLEAHLEAQGLELAHRIRRRRHAPFTVSGLFGNSD